MVTIEDLCKGQEPKIESALANLYALGFRLAPTLKLNPRQRFVVAQVLDRSLRDVTEFAQRNRRARGDWQRVYERLRDETGQARNPEAIDEESKFLDVMRLVDDRVKAVQRNVMKVAREELRQISAPAGGGSVDTKPLQEAVGRIGPLETAVASLRQRVEAVQDGVVGILANLEQAINKLGVAVREVSDAHRDLTARTDKLQAIVEESLRAKQAWPERFRVLQARVDAATARGKRVLPQPDWLSGTSDHLVDGLRKAGFWIPRETVDQIAYGLQRRVVVVRGVPGTGKSTLVRHIATTLLGGTADEVCHFEGLGPDTTFEKAVGSRAVTQDRRVGPGLGFLTESILRCYERNQGYWLILDEFNRGNPDRFLTPLLDVLARGEGWIEHPHMFPDRPSGEVARIPFPPMFRILGTMNHVDRGLYPLSEGLQQRLAFVDLMPVEGGQEREIVLGNAWASWSRHAPAHQLERVKQHCDQLLTEILEVVQSIRNAARDAREVASIGARPGIETMRVALAICASGGTRRRPVTEIVDEALSQELAPQLDRLSVGMLDSIRQAWEGRYPRFARRIREIVVGRAWS